MTDTDAKAYRHLSLRAVLEGAARVKKAKYPKVCLGQQRTIAPLAYSVDGMAGVEARAFEKCIASLLAAKWGREYSELMGSVRATMAMAVARANTLLLRGVRLTRPKWIPFVNGAALEGFPGLREL